DVGNAVEAELILKRGCAVAQEIGDTIGQAQVLNALSSTQESLGHNVESLESSRQAVALFKAAPVLDPAGLADALYFQGWAHYRLGQAEAALNTAEEGYLFSQAAHLPDAEARCLNL